MAGRSVGLDFGRYKRLASLAEARFVETLDLWPKASKQIVTGILHFLVSFCLLITQGINRLGLRVVLDVVYNHVFSTGPASVQSNFDKVRPLPSVFCGVAPPSVLKLYCGRPHVLAAFLCMYCAFNNREECKWCQTWFRVLRRQAPLWVCSVL